MKLSNSKTAVGGAAFFASAALALALVPGSATATGGGDDNRSPGRTVQHAHLDSLNNSGVTGHAKVKSRNKKLHIDVKARGLAKNLPHAQHIHYGEQARHECPTVKDDTNGDFRLNTAEGLPAYGGIAVSMTKRGDTSPASGLAVDRFPTAPRGKIDYERTTKTSKEVARAIRNGEGVVVIHGIDYNNNGSFDFESAGASELDPNLPAEATDPAACGVLR